MPRRSAGRGALQIATWQSDRSEIDLLARHVFPAGAYNAPATELSNKAREKIGGSPSALYSLTRSKGGACLFVFFFRSVALSGVERASARA